MQPLRADHGSHCSSLDQAAEQAGAAPKCSVEAVVINLRRASDRRRQMTPMLEKLDFKWSYFEAHTGLQHPDLRHDPLETKRHYGRALTMPQIAVYSSHYAIVKQYLESGTADFLLVMEDDIIFDTEFPFETFAGFCAERGIDYVRLFGKHFAPAVWLGFFYDRNIIRHRTTPTGCQAYLVSKKGAEMLTAKMREVNTAVDLAMDSFWESQLPIYSIHPYPVIERYVPTSIPIPDLAEPLSASEKLVFSFNRTVKKLKKIWANRALRSADQRIKDLSPPFRQVFGCAQVKV
jgi:GR25 family glycosyltransferase involved in LPS biosynthesis